MSRWWRQLRCAWSCGHDWVKEMREHYPGRWWRLTKRCRNCRKIVTYLVG